MGFREKKMTLTADKQELGAFSQKEPLKFGFIKEKAKAAGMSTQDFIGHFADKLMSMEQQPTQQKDNKDIAEVKDIIKEQAKLLETLTITLSNSTQNKPQQIENPLNNLSSLISAFKELQNYNNSVIEGYKTTQNDALTSLKHLQEGEEGEEFAPEDYFMKVLADKMAGKLNSTPLSSTNTTKEVSISSQNHSQVSPPVIVPKNKEEIPMKEEDIAKVAAEIPPNIQEQIKKNELTLASAKNLVKNSQYGGFISDSDVEKVYNKVKNDILPKKSD